MIEQLESIKLISEDDGCIDEMLEKEYASALKTAGFDLNHIYLINGNRFKTKFPIQICRKRRIDVLKELYKYYFGEPKKNSTLQEVYEAAIIEYGKHVLEGVDSPYARLLRLDLCLTVRIGELEAIKWSDVDLNKGSLLIHSQIVIKKVDGTRKQVYVPYTKSNKYDNGHGKRRLKLNSKAIEVLKEQRLANPFGEYVFVSKNGTPLWTNKINEHLKEYCHKAGIRYLSSHSIRVSNITSLYDCGVSPTKIQVAAGHSDIRTTNGYCRSEICDEIDLSVLEEAL